MNYCSNCNIGISKKQAETTEKLLSKPLCEACAAKESAETAEQFTTPEVRAKRLLESRGFREHKSKKGLWIAGEEPNMRFVDLNKQPFEIGVLLPDGERITEGHGIQELEWLKDELDAIYNSKKKSSQLPSSCPNKHVFEKMKKELKSAPAAPHQAQIGFLTPATSLEEAIQVFELFEQAKTKLLKDSDILWIGPDGKPTKKGSGQPYIKRSGWRKLARFFGINCSILGKEKIISKDSEGEYYIWKYRVRAQHPSGVFFDAEGICTSRDPFFSKKHGQRIVPDEADIMLKAQTVAFNRAISDLLGGGEVSAEEVGDVT